MGTRALHWPVLHSTTELRAALAPTEGWALTHTTQLLQRRSRGSQARSLRKRKALGVGSKEERERLGKESGQSMKEQKRQAG